MKNLNSACFAIFCAIVCFFPKKSFSQCPEVVWSDEFDGTSLDQTKWESLLGDGCSINLCGWGNNELQSYRAENTSVSDGNLKITAKRENFGGKNYTSSRIRTRYKGDWTYGRLEARIKLPKGQGLWPAFWMMPTDEVYGSWPQSGEIDIMELVGHEPEVVHGTIHFGNVPPSNRSTGTAYKLNSGTFNDDFHTFAVEWEEGEIRWFVDDYLYSTKRIIDVSPFRWPFDQNFHFILNVAVGGNWPGSPDGSTVFPQVMEVDYVRVYDGNLPHLSGKRTVENDAKESTYSVVNALDGSSFNWSVPSGASIVSGQGTESITVAWGETGGKVEVDITGTCSDQKIAVDVEVEPNFAPDFYFLDFDNPDLLTLDFSSGQYSPDTDNPAPNDVNSSALVGKYERDGNTQFDVLYYKVSDIGDALEYVNGEKKFYLDVYTSAPIGSEILIQLENSGLARSDNYPTGRHSRYQAFVNKTNAWERLEFNLLDQPDGSVSRTSIDELVFLFQPGQFSGSTFFIDNFASYNAQEVVSIDPEPTELPFSIYPNPTNDNFTIELANQGQPNQLTLFDQNGRVVLTREFIKEEVISMRELARGIYFVWVRSGNQVASKKIIKQ